jgi:hypothetical protein
VSSRRCPRCEDEKDLSEFHQRGTSTYCKVCTNAYNAEWRRKNIDKARHIDRAAKRKRAYGISEADFAAMREAQGDRCAICREMFTETPCVDHGHDTGKVRGLLCRSCNTGLGAFRDNPLLLKMAARYVMFDRMEAISLELAQYLGPSTEAIDVPSIEIVSAMASNER